MNKQNHSCKPNCEITPVYINDTTLNKPLLTIFAFQDIDAGEEITVSYFGDRKQPNDQGQASSGSDDESDEEGKASNFVSSMFYYLRRVS